MSRLDSFKINATRFRQTSLITRNKISLLVAVLAVLLAPFPFGSTDHFWLGLWCILLSASLLIVKVSSIGTHYLPVMMVPILVFILYALLAFLQIQPGLEWPHAHPVWKEASQLLGLELPGRISVMADSPPAYLLEPLTMLLAFQAGLLLAFRAGHDRLILKIFALFAVSYAVFAITLFLSDPTKVLWRPKRHHLQNLTATFMNRNTAAAFFGAATIIWFVFLLEEIGRYLPKNQGRLKFLDFLHRITPTRRMVHILIGFLLCLGTVFMTGSRAGSLLLCVALVLAGGLSYRRLLPSGANTFIAIGIVAIIAIMIMQLWGESVAIRLDHSGFADPARLEAYKASLAIVVKNPWFGTGIGSFSDIFPEYRTLDSSNRGLWDRAHNSLLEVTVEAGLPMASIILTMWVFLGWKLLQGALSDSRRALTSICAFSIFFYSSLHSLIDYPLQIPGYALVFSFIAGTGISRTLKLQNGKPVI